MKTTIELLQHQSVRAHIASKANAGTGKSARLEISHFFFTRNNKTIECIISYKLFRKQNDFSAEENFDDLNAAILEYDAFNIEKI